MILFRGQEKGLYSLHEDNSAVSKLTSICFLAGDCCIIFLRTVSTWVDVNEH